MNTRLVPLVAALTAALPSFSGLALAQDTRPALPLIRPAEPVPAERSSDPYEALVEEFQAARNAWYQAYAKARQGGDEAIQEFLQNEPRPEAVFVPRFAEQATAHAGKPTAVRYLVWLARNDGQNRKVHIQTLFDAHFEDPAMATVPPLLTYERDEKWALALMQRLIDDSEHELAQLNARMTRAELYKRTGDPEKVALAKADYEVLVECNMPGLVSRAKGNLFELENLQIGMVAPDIEGEDLHGETFRLSDYRGQVVVLDFWGDW